MASEKTPSSHPGTYSAYQPPYRVVALRPDGKVVSVHYLYSRLLAQMQLGILLDEPKYSYCRIVLYDPAGEVVFMKDPND